MQYMRALREVFSTAQEVSLNTTKRNVRADRNGNINAIVQTHQSAAKATASDAAAGTDTDNVVAVHLKGVLCVPFGTLPRNGVRRLFEIN